MRGLPPTSEFEKGKGWKGVEMARILPAFQRARKGVLIYKVITDSGGRGSEHKGRINQGNVPK